MAGFARIKGLKKLTIVMSWNFHCGNESCSCQSVPIPRRARRRNRQKSIISKSTAVSDQSPNSILQPIQILDPVARQLYPPSERHQHPPSLISEVEATAAKAGWKKRIRHCFRASSSSSSPTQLRNKNPNQSTRIKILPDRPRGRNP